MKLEYVIVPGQWPEPEIKDLYQNVFNCWWNVWTDAFKELGKPEGYLKSDAFTRQDYVGGILVDGKCLAVCFYRWADPTMPTMAKDSYFSNWGETHIQKLRSRGDKIVVCSNFTVAREARGVNLGFSMKDLLMGTVAKTFAWLNPDGMTAALRRDRNVQGVCGKWGAQEIAYEVPSGHGDTVELMGFFSDVMAKHPRQELSDLVDKLWNESPYIPSTKEIERKIAV
jgi:hypothetical protein